MRKIRIFAHTSLDGVISPASRTEGDDECVASGATPYSPLEADPAVAEKHEKRDPEHGRGEE